MSYNLVRHLPRYGFRGLNTLETIDLSYNDIREVDERAFEDMRWVTTLKVREGRGGESTNLCQMPNYSPTNNASRNHSALKTEVSSKMINETQTGH